MRERGDTTTALATVAALTSAAGLFVILYGATLSAMVVEWLSSPDASYGAVLVVVAAAVAWQRRRAFVRAIVPDGRRVPGLSVLAIGATIYLGGLFGADVFLTRLSFVVILTGTVWFVAGGAAVRTVAAPLAFLAMAVPLPALVVNAVTLPMQLAASSLAESMLGVAGVPVYRDGNILALPSTSLQVAEACSGLRSLVSLVAIGVVVATLAGRPLLRRVALMAACVPIAVALNALRIAVTGVACEVWGRQAASEPWHSFGGWLTFALSVVVLLSWQRTMDRVRAPRLFGPIATARA